MSEKKTFSVPHSWSGKQDSPTLAILLPGRGYSNQMPLMYYSRMALEHLGFAVLSIHYDHRNSSEQVPPLLKPQMDELEAFLADRPFTRYVLVGKSLGTLAMGFLFKHSRFAHNIGIWLTPILFDEGVRTALRNTQGLVVYGTADPAAQDPFREELFQTRLEQFLG